MNVMSVNPMMSNSDLGLQKNKQRSFSQNVSFGINGEDTFELVSGIAKDIKDGMPYYSAVAKAPSEKITEFKQKIAYWFYKERDNIGKGLPSTILDVWKGQNDWELAEEQLHNDVNFVLDNIISPRKSDHVPRISIPNGQSEIEFAPDTMVQLPSEIKRIQEEEQKNNRIVLINKYDNQL